MIYIIVALLLILVLANETARGLLFLLLIGAVILALAGAALFAIFLLGAWIFTSNKSTSISEKTAVIAQTQIDSSYSPIGYFFVILFVVGIPAFIAYDQYKLRKK